MSNQEERGRRIHYPLLFLSLAFLGVACRQDRDSSAHTTPGRPAQPPTEDIGCSSLPAVHDVVYGRGVDLITPYMILHDEAVKNDADRPARLKAGIACIDRALSMVPSNWAALWVRGKAFQALDDHLQAHGSFASAYALQPENPDVGRELGVECLELGKFAEAVTIAEHLTKVAPQDAGLRANLALALLLDGQVQRAREVIAEARRQDPKDPISKTLEELINQVADGSRRQPKTLRELEQ